MPANNKRQDTKGIQAAKRKRVNRLKRIIVAGAVILLLTSVILNFVLVFKVLHLESQINQLYSLSHVQVLQNQQCL